MESLESLGTVSKQFLPQLYMLKTIADNEDEHEVRKVVRDYKRHYQLDADKYKQLNKPKKKSVQ